MAGTRSVRGIVVAFLTVCQPLYSQAQTVWSGAGGNDNWTTSQNWLGGVAPLSGPSTWIRLQGTVRQTPVVDSYLPWVLNRLDFESQGSGASNSFTLSGNQLSFRGTAPQIYVYAFADQVINNDIDLSASDVLLGAYTYKSLTLNGHVSGAGGLVVATGVHLNNANTYDGTTTIGLSPNSGAVYLTHPQGLGSTVGGTVLRSGSLYLSGGITVASESLSIMHGSSLLNYSGSNTWTGSIVTSGQTGISSLHQGETFTITGSIDGSGGGLAVGGAGDIVITGTIRNLTQWNLSKYGTGALRLGGVNSNIYEIVVSDGVLVATTHDALPPVTPIQLNPNTGNYYVNAYPTLRIQDDTTIGGLSSNSSGGIPTVDLGSSNLTINQNFFSTFSGQVTGSGSLIKSGTGTLQLAITNSYSGSIVINGGAIRIFQDSDLGALTPAERITLNGGALEALSYYSVILDPNRIIQLAGPGQFTSYLSTANSFIVQGQITGPGGLSTSGPLVRLSNSNNNYTGGTNILSGFLQFDNPGAIGGIGPNVKIASGATATAGYPIDQAFLARVDPTSSGTIGLTMANGNDLDFGTAGLTSVFLGAVTTQTFSGTLYPASGLYRLGAGIGTLELTKLNAIGGNSSLEVGSPTGIAGTVILSNDNNLAGDVTVNDGTLKINGSRLGFANADVKAGLNLANATLTGIRVAVEATGFLTGCGTIDADLVNDGQAFVTCGQLTVNGDLTNNGQLAVHGDSTLVASGSFVNNGLLDLLTSTSAVLPTGFVNNGTIVHFGEVKVESVAKTGTTFRLIAHSLSGHNYQLQRANSLTVANWIPIGIPAPGFTGHDVTLADYNSTGSQEFYRIQVSP